MGKSKEVVADVKTCSYKNLTFIFIVVVVLNSNDKLEFFGSYVNRDTIRAGLL